MLLKYTHMHTLHRCVKSIAFAAVDPGAAGAPAGAATGAGCRGAGGRAGARTTTHFIEFVRSKQRALIYIRVSYLEPVQPDS